MVGAPPLLHTDPVTGELRRRRWILEVLDGQDAGRRTEVDRSPALIGAAPAAVLVLTDDTVSRYHLEMDVFAEGIRLRDLDSTNGTFIGDLRVRDAFVEQGDVFRLGRTSVKVRAADEPAAPEIDTDPRGVPLGAIEYLGDALAVSTHTRGLFETIRQVASSPSAVLMEGPPGTGKATCARQMHDLSPRKAQPYVVVTLPPNADEAAIDTILFGEGVPGTTGDVNAGRPGAFERASGGTLFIEHVDRMPSGTQPRVLRAIESGEIQRIGERRRRRVDVRLISSAEAVAADAPGLGATILRRLAVVRLSVPALIERPEDIVPLAGRFLEQISDQPFVIGPVMSDLLAKAQWVRNGDELRDCLIGVLDDDPACAPFRHAFVTDVVAFAAGDVTAAARNLGITQLKLFRYLADQNIDLDAM